MSEKKLSFTHRFIPATDPAITETLLLLHGTGGSEHDLLGLGSRLRPGAALLSPRGKVLENGMPRFFRRLAEGVFDVEDVKRQSQALAEFVVEASQAYGLDERNITAVGYSNGANIAGGLLLLRPKTLAAAALLRPMVPLLPEKLPDLKGKEVLILSGRSDPIATPTETARLVKLFSDAGATVNPLAQPDGHQLSDEDVRAAEAWFASRSAKAEAVTRR
ncbi:MAG: alpha/beta hydrolase [Phycisphaeraceae bacterium]|nr:alpha/beta hydrolase [Phycisphaeraceae bacterium]